MLIIVSEMIFTIPCACIFFIEEAPVQIMLTIFFSLVVLQVAVME